MKAIKTKMIVTGVRALSDDGLGMTMASPCQLSAEEEVIEKSREATYIYDICVKCGKIIRGDQQ